MDKIIRQKKWSKRRLLTWGGTTAVATLILFSYYFTRGNLKLNVPADRLVISEVTRGPFRELIPVNGVVLPVTTIYLDIVEGGRVEEKFAEDGAILKKGQPILKLSNTDLELSLVNQETAVFNLLTQMQISTNAARQNTIAKLNQSADVENGFREAERVYLTDKKLFEQKAIGSQEYRQAGQAYEYQQKRRKLAMDVLVEDSISSRQEESQARESYNRTQEALALMRRKVGDLVVAAPIDGQLTSLDAEIGQNKNKGERIGQIDAVSGFKIRTDIDEHYVNRIVPGQEATCTVGNKEYSLVVKKIFTQISKGSFQADLVFKDSIPGGVRRGQSLLVKLALSEETQAILVPRGGFYEQTAGNWIFLVSRDGKHAYRKPIKIGRQNPEDFEVLDGLKPGDRVITSGYETYEKINELTLEHDSSK